MLKKYLITVALVVVVVAAIFRVSPFRKVVVGQ
jgi:hypothetical protein